MRIVAALGGNALLERGELPGRQAALPSTVDSLIGTALAGGATTLKPAARGFWGYGGVVQNPGGAIWKVATSSKKDTGPATRQVDLRQPPAWLLAMICRNMAVSCGAV